MFVMSFALCMFVVIHCYIITLDFDIVCFMLFSVLFSRHTKNLCIYEDVSLFSFLET